MNHSFPLDFLAELDRISFEFLFFLWGFKFYLLLIYSLLFDLAKFIDFFVFAVFLEISIILLYKGLLFFLIHVFDKEVFLLNA